MSESKKLIPKRRFKGFEDTGKWQTNKLSVMAEFSKGNGYSKNDLREYGIPIILYGRLYTKYETIIKSVDTFVDQKINSAVFSTGVEVVVPASGETSEDIARASFIEQSALIIGGDLNILKPKTQLNSVFLALSLSNGNQRKELIKRAQGKTVVHIHNSDLKEVNLNFPIKNEQIKIGEFFKKLDNLISTQQKKLEKAKTLKLAYLTEMFPKKGKLKPKCRFLSFSYNWEKFKIKELFTITRGKVLASNQVSMNRTSLYSYPVYSSQTKNNGLMGYYKEYLFENAITWTTDGANAGTVNYRENKFYSTNVNGVLLSSDGFANKAIAEMLNTIAWKYVSKVGNPKLMNIVMAEIPILIPKLEEQTKIGNFFKLLDDKIALEQKKLNKLKNIKQAYLNEMFV
jgi:type I restriction enzyme, S subunit